MTDIALYMDFPLKDVQLLDDYYTDITQKDVDFLNTFNPDKLLYNFRLTAGYTKKELADGRFDFAKNGNIATSSYSGWENTRIGGHTLGHYLTAAAQAIARGYGSCEGGEGATLEKRVDYILEGLLDCQRKNDDIAAFGTGAVHRDTELVQCFFQRGVFIVQQRDHLRSEAGRLHSRMQPEFLPRC